MTGPSVPLVVALCHVLECIGFRYVGCYFNSILHWMPLHSFVDMLTSSKRRSALLSWALNIMHGWLNSMCLYVHPNKVLLCCTIYLQCFSIIGWCQKWHSFCKMYCYTAPEAFFLHILVPHRTPSLVPRAR